MAENANTPEAVGPTRPTRVRFAVLAALCSLAFLTYLDRIAIMRVQGEIERDLEFGKLAEEDEGALRERGEEMDPDARAKLSQDRARSRMGWVFAAFLLGYVLLEIPGGWLGDIWGPRRVIVRIVVAWSIFTALTGSVRWIAGWFAENPEPPLMLGILIAVRFLFGLGEAGAYPNIARALGRWFPVRDRAAAQGMIWLSSRIGGALAPAIVGRLMLLPIGGGGWQQAFWILGAAGSLWALWFAFWFRDRPEEMAAANQAEGALIRSGLEGARSIYDDAHAAGVPWRRLLLSRNLIAIYIAAASVSFSWYFLVTYLPRYLNESWGVDYKSSEVLTGLPLLVGGIACLAGGRLSDRLVRRLGDKRWGRSLVGIAGFGGAGLCSLAVPLAGSPGAVIALLCLASALQDLAVPCIWSLPADVGGRYAGTVGGCMNSVGAIGGVLSPLAAAGLASSGGGWNAVFLLFASVYFLGALMWLRIDASEMVLEEENGTAAAAG